VKPLAAVQACGSVFASANSFLDNYFANRRFNANFEAQNGGCKIA